ncbi:hypothetical protein ABK040_007907 [Willaertia magna]
MNNNYNSSIGKEVFSLLFENAINCKYLLEDNRNILVKELQKINNKEDKKIISNIYLKNLKTYFIENDFILLNNKFQSIEYLLNNLKILCERFERYLNVLNILQNCLKLENNELIEEFTIFTQTKLFFNLNIDVNDLNYNLSNLLQNYFNETFQTFIIMIEENQEQENILIFKNFCKQLQFLNGNFLNSIFTSNLIEFIFKKIKEKIIEIASNDFEQEILAFIQQWKEQFIYPFIEIYNNELFKTLKTQIDYFIYETMTRIRIEQIFDIIISYPSSHQSILDLKECLNQCGLHNELIETLNKNIKNRLLIASVETKTIIMAFMNIVKTLLIIDPTSILLDKISFQLKDYLREKRNDTIKSIIQEMIDEKNNTPLYNELLSSDPQSNYDSDSENNLENWNPTPIHPSSANSKMERVDIIKTFIEMFRGNKDLFVNEYRIILADKLLFKREHSLYDTSDESKMVELLKIRFGERCMQNCEIMLKDIVDSKFLNNNIHNRLKNNNIKLPSFPNITLDDNFIIQQQETIPNCFMISKNYWPPYLFQKEGQSTNNLMEDDSNINTIQLHPFVEQLMLEYANQYNAIKAPRKLLWEKHLGSLDFDIEIGGEEVSFTNIHPISASILFYFSDKPKWNINELCEIIKIDEKQVLKRINIWLKRKIIIMEENNECSLVDKLTEIENQNEDEEMEDTSGQNQEEEMRVYQDLIVGMLTSTSMPLDKIHNFLALFALDPLPPFDKTIPELGNFLNILIKEEILVCEDGEYKVRE